MSGVRSLVLVTAVVMVLLYGLHAAVTPDLSERNVEFMTEMVYSQANESFSGSSVLAGGRTQQGLVAGVVPRGALPFAFGDGAEEAARAGRELANPFAAGDEAAVKRGAALFGIYCALCHDGAGNGRGTIVEHGMLPPPSLHALRAQQMGDGEMFHILTRGQGNMASHAAQLSPDERWKVILHVRRLQEANGS